MPEPKPGNHSSDQQNPYWRVALVIRMPYATTSGGTAIGYYQWLEDGPSFDSSAAAREFGRLALTQMGNPPNAKIRIYQDA